MATYAPLLGTTDNDDDRQTDITYKEPEKAVAWLTIMQQ